MKKSVASFILNGSVKGVRKCIPPLFLKLFGVSNREATEKNFLIFSRNFYYDFRHSYFWTKTMLL